MTEKEKKAREYILEAMKLLVEERRMTFVNELQSVANRIYPQGRGTVYAIANPARARLAMADSGEVVEVGNSNYKPNEWIHPALRTDAPVVEKKKAVAGVTDTESKEGGDSGQSTGIEFTEDMTDEQIIEAFGSENKLRNHLKEKA